MNSEERANLLTQVAGCSSLDAQEIEKVLVMMPQVTLDIKCQTEGEEGIQEGDLVTIQSWVTLKRSNGLIGALPHAPFYPFPKDENYWIILADTSSNNVWFSQKLNFMDEASAINLASLATQEKMESLGADAIQTNSAVKEVVEKVKNGSRLVTGKLQAAAEGTFNLTCFCLCDSWIGCDAQTSLKLKVTKRTRAGTRGFNEVIATHDESEEDDDEEDEEEDEGGYKSEYSEDDEVDDGGDQKPKATKKVPVKNKKAQASSGRGRR